MERLIVAAVLAAVAVGVALLVQRRRPPAPMLTGRAVPDQIDRADFARPDAAWLVAVFTSASCDACAGTWDKARHLESEQVAVERLEHVEDRAVFDRYGIEGVPTLLVADRHGGVRASFLGPPTATDLWATLAELREPGCTPAACDHGQPG